VRSFSCAKLALPTGAWTMPAFSTRNSTLPALISRMALVDVAVTVPTLGFGIRPRGPAPYRGGHDAHHVGRGDHGVEVHEALFDALRQLLGPDDVGAGGLGLLALSPLAKTATFLLRPVPWAGPPRPRTIWSACLGSTPRLMAMSTV